jgi:hypothetical protein
MTTKEKYMNKLEGKIGIPMVSKIPAIASQLVHPLL